MPYRSMTVEEFAKHVGLDVQEARRLADRGKLPGQKVAGQWRFNRAQVTEWLQQEMPMLGEDRLAAVERAMSGRTEEAVPETSMVVTNLIGLDGIDIAFAAKTKASALRDLVKLAGRTDLLYDSDGLLEALQQREALCSTALPNGVAIPHPRQPLPYVSAEPLICVGRTSSGIAFGAPRGELTRLFFMICCHTDRYHLHVLARLMRILSEGTAGRLMDTGTTEELLEIMMAKEKEIIAKLR